VSALYNEIEPYAAAWLANLSDAGHIARGVVDVRSIRDLRADDVVGATQFHTFAGLGAWSYALRLAGWPDERPVWTGSCPCQPFSDAGKGGGTADERHLWPEWFRLIRECRPPIVFGEQVASGAGLAWLDVVRADLEAEGYAVGAADLCAAGVGAPHIRQRLFFGAVRVGHPDGYGTGKHGRVHDGCESEHAVGAAPLCHAAATSGAVGDVASPWARIAWLPCRDGKARPTQPGLLPLAHGVPARVGRLRAYGNAIVPQVAAAFVRAFMEATT
jgi:DNA (cytosine-5)-methyltransferase 1